MWRFYAGEEGRSDRWWCSEMQLPQGSGVQWSWLDQQLSCSKSSFSSCWSKNEVNICALKISNCKQLVICTVEELTVFSNRWPRKAHEEDNYLWWFLSGSPQACAETTEPLFPWAVAPQGPVLLGLHPLRMSVCVHFLIRDKERSQDAAFQ